MTREEALEKIIDAAKRPPSDPRQLRELDAWLDRSPEYRALYEEQLELFSAMDLWEPAEPSAGFDRKLYERLEQEAAPGRWAAAWLGWMRPSFVAAMAALALVAASIVLDRPESPQVAVKAEPAAARESDYLFEIDRALQDLEMLADFEEFPIEMDPAGRS